jgi:D-aspartate ligase
MSRPARSGSDGDPGANPAAILLGGGLIALAVARGLSPAGVPVYALGHESDPVRWSRHCSHFVDTDAGPGVQERWLAWLEHGPREGVVLPCNDDALELVVSHRGRLEALGYLLMEADDEVLAAMLDKARTYELARTVGVAAPRTVTLHNSGDVADVAERIGFPCAVKPLHSHLFAYHYGILKKVFLAAGPRELERAFVHMDALGIEALATEIVPGPDRDFASFFGYLREDGEPLLQFTKQKHRQYPTRFGMGCYHTTDWNSEVAELGLRFLQGVGVRGLACVEFKRDARDGQLVLIECNHRFTATTELLRAAGVNLALFTYNRLLGRELPPVDSYRRGLHLWVPGIDVRALIGYVRDGELSLRSWVASLIGPQRFTVASREDPRPVLRAVAYKLRRAPRKLSRRYRRSIGDSSLPRSDRPLLPNGDPAATPQAASAESEPRRG